MTEAFESFLKKQDVKFYKSYNMKRISSIGIGGIAETAVLPNTKEKLINAVRFAAENHLKYKVVGRMTNILPCDEDFQGILILTKDIDGYFVAENRVVAECGVLLSLLIRELASLNLGGMSALYGIPGSVGGAVFGNAGAYGNNISDFFVEGEFYSVKENKILKLTKSDMKFSYRESGLKNSGLIILNATFSLLDVSNTEEKGLMKSVIIKRKSSQPYGEKSLGSVFKRKGDVPISKLIDNLGLKGYRIGDAQISTKHAGFIINLGSASAKDVIALKDFIKERIYCRYGFIPDAEIEFLNGD